MKIKSVWKKNISKVKRMVNWEKILTTDIIRKGLISLIIQEGSRNQRKANNSTEK